MARRADVLAHLEAALQRVLVERAEQAFVRPAAFGLKQVVAAMATGRGRMTFGGSMLGGRGRSFHRRSGGSIRIDNRRFRARSGRRGRSVRIDNRRRSSRLFSRRRGLRRGWRRGLLGERGDAERGDRDHGGGAGKGELGKTHLSLPIPQPRRQPERPLYDHAHFPQSTADAPSVSR